MKQEELEYGAGWKPRLGTLSLRWKVLEFHDYQSPSLIWNSRPAMGLSPMDYMLVSMLV